jgi:hypothetical protein
VNKKRSGATTKLFNLTSDSRQCQREQPFSEGYSRGFGRSISAPLPSSFDIPASHVSRSKPSTLTFQFSLSRFSTKARFRFIIPAMTYLYLLLGLVVGALSGIVGIGGGIMISPALVYFFHMSQHKAQGTSLAALLAPIGALAFWEYYKAGNVDLKAGLLIALGFLVGGYFGGLWAQHLPEVVLRRVFGTLLAIIGIQLLLSRG